MARRNPEQINHHKRTPGDKSYLKSKGESQDKVPVLVRCDIGQEYDAVCKTLRLVSGQYGTPDYVLLLRFSGVFYIANPSLRDEIISLTEGAVGDNLKKVSFERLNHDTLSELGPKSTLLRLTAEWLRRHELMARSQSSSDRTRQARDFFSRWEHPLKAPEGLDLDTFEMLYDNTRLANMRWPVVPEWSSGSYLTEGILKPQTLSDQPPIHATTSDLLQFAFACRLSSK